MRKLWIVLAAGALVALPAGAAIYKWVDKDGITHYTETPPPDADARELPIAPGPSAPEAAPADANEAAPAAPAAKTPEERAREQAEEQKRVSDSRKTWCALAQRNVQVLQSPNPVVELDGNGQQMIVSGEQRAAALADAKRRVQTYCAPQAALSP